MMQSVLDEFKKVMNAKAACSVRRDRSGGCHHELRWRFVGILKAPASFTWMKL